MPDIKIENDALEDIKKSLDTIKSSFEGLRDDVSGKRDIWGHRKVTRSVEAFEWNWRGHREDIVKTFSGLTDKVQKIIDGFADTDQRLVDAQDEKD